MSIGLNSSCYAWQHQTNYLAATGKYTVMILDNRGFGGSDAPTGFYSTSQMAKDTMEVLDHVGWDKNVHLNGVSMGGMIALELVYAHPERFASLILTSTTPGKHLPPFTGISALSQLLFIKDNTEKVKMVNRLMFPADWLAAKPDQKVYSQFSTNEEVMLAAALDRIERSGQPTLIGHIGQLAACIFHNVSEKRLKKIKESKIPTLVVTGTWDNLVNPANSYYLAKILDCKMEIFEGSGHALPGEQPVKYNDVMEKHFMSAHKQ
ncbi:Alpha/Beta hydrolase protein [Pilobolus umbonatus]|nr:Alpha/Beta hydrolase protein [Pilobolus umbonatus]